MRNIEQPSTTKKNLDQRRPPIDWIREHPTGRSHEYEDSHTRKSPVDWQRDFYAKQTTRAGDLHISPASHEGKQLPNMLERFSTVDKWFETFKNEDLHLLSPEEKDAFLQNLQERKWAAEHALRLIKPTDKDAGIVSSHFDQDLKGLESFKQETMEKIERYFDGRSKSINAAYRELIKKLELRNGNLIERSGSFGSVEADHSIRESTNKLRETYSDQLQKFRRAREQTRGNYGVLTFSDCKDHLNNVEASLMPIIEEAYPAARNTIARAMRTVKHDANVISTILDKNGIQQNPYRAEILQADFQRIEWQTMQNLLTRPVLPKDHTQVSGIEGSQSPSIPRDLADRPLDFKGHFEDLNQFTSRVGKTRENCEAVVTDVKYIRMLLGRPNPDGTKNEVEHNDIWDNKLKHLLRGGLLEVTQGVHNGENLNDIHKILKDMNSDKDDIRLKSIVTGEKSIADIFDNEYRIRKNNKLLKSRRVHSIERNIKAYIETSKEMKNLMQKMKNKWPDHRESAQLELDSHQRENYKDQQQRILYRKALKVEYRENIIKRGLNTVMVTATAALMVYGLNYALHEKVGNWSRNANRYSYEQESGLRPPLPSDGVMQPSHMRGSTKVPRRSVESIPHLLVSTTPHDFISTSSTHKFMPIPTVHDQVTHFTDDTTINTLTTP